MVAAVPVMLSCTLNSRPGDRCSSAAVVAGKHAWTEPPAEPLGQLPLTSTVCSGAWVRFMSTAWDLRPAMAVGRSRGSVCCAVMKLIGSPDDAAAMLCVTVAVVPVKSVVDAVTRILLLWLLVSASRLATVTTEAENAAAADAEIAVTMTVRAVMLKASRCNVRYLTAAGIRGMGTPLPPPASSTRPGRS